MRVTPALLDVQPSKFGGGSRRRHLAESPAVVADTVLPLATRVELFIDAWRGLPDRGPGLSRTPRMISSSPSMSPTTVPSALIRASRFVAVLKATTNG